MKDFIKLSSFALLLILVLTLYFEYIVNRPVNIYIQYIGSGLALIYTVFSLVYIIKQIIKLLNP
jgi:hypothetical protein